MLLARSFVAIRYGIYEAHLSITSIFVDSKPSRQSNNYFAFNAMAIKKKIIYRLKLDVLYFQRNTRGKNPHDNKKCCSAVKYINSSFQLSLR